MSQYLHRLSAFLFFALGTAMFAAYILWRNDISTTLALRTMLTLDLPLLASGMLYGALSIARSIDPDGEVRSVKWILLLPLLVLFFIAAFFKLS